jgi:NAD(P)-dependent dehydrogenase (short-subunit alcohol dehydrogenase family)
MDSKTWLVTGCSSGIGLGIVSAALEAGDKVVAGVRREGSLDSLRDSFSGYADRLLVLRLDVTDPQKESDAVEAACGRFGNVDVLVNNAGYGYRAAVEESDREQVDRLMETNLFGPARLINLVLPQMRSRGAGTIVNVSSIGGVRAAPANAYYSASKAAIEMVSDGLRKELAVLGIRVMIVEPGAFRTRFYDSLEGSATRISDYDGAIGSMRVDKGTERPHNQPGDPMAAGRAIVGVVRGNAELPVRLALGSDAVRVLRQEYQQRLDELAAFEQISASADFGE